MLDEGMLRQLAREALLRGKLPSCAPERMWGGPGSGERCTLCGREIEPEDIEFEFERRERSEVSGDCEAYRLHTRCFAAWEFEREKVGGHNTLPTQPGKTGGGPKETSASAEGVVTPLPSPGEAGMIAGRGRDNT